MVQPDGTGKEAVVLVKQQAVVLAVHPFLAPAGEEMCI